MTQRRLRNIALHYFEARTTTAGHLRRLLWRRAQRSLAHHGGDEAEVRGWIDALIPDLERMGLLDDRAWATSRVARLRRRGMSSRAIRAKLREKLVDPQLIDEVLAEDAPDPRHSAVRYARRRGLGPFRTRDRDAQRERDLGRLARAGFAFDVARAVLDLEPDEADALHDEALATQR